MDIGKNGLSLIKGYEGFRASAYLDSGGIPTIGYGTIQGVKMGQTITEAVATSFLQRDIGSAAATVTNAVKVPLNQDQFDALVCFVYNVGGNAFKTSTLLKLLNSGQYDQVPAQLLRWNKVNGNAVGGLTRRRTAEGILFSTGRVQL